jgi:hypothetical protein
MRTGLRSGVDVKIRGVEIEPSRTLLFGTNKRGFDGEAVQIVKSSCSEQFRFRISGLIFMAFVGFVAWAMLW